MTSPPVPTDPRAASVLAGANLAGVGLEIGPSFNPIAPKRDGYNVRILDHTTQAGLVAKYQALGIGPEQLDQIEEVDYVWTGEPLSEATNGDKFDYIIAAHVLEHTTDLIGFLNETSSMLTEGGVLSLLVPDKRYCFDYYRPVSTAGAVYEAHKAQAAVHGPASFIDTHLHFVLRHGTDNTWDANNVDDLQLAPCAWPNVHKTLTDLAAADEYTDIHRWVFTPASLELLVSDLRSLGFLHAKIESVAVAGQFEFAVTFSRSEAPDGSEPPKVEDPWRQEMLEQIAVEQAQALPAWRETTSQLELLQAQYAEMRDHAAELGAHILELGGYIGELQAEVAAKDALIAQRDANIAEITDSVSWRATQPLRSLKSAANARRRQP